MDKESQQVKFYKSLSWLLEHSSADPKDWDAPRKLEEGSTYHTTDYIKRYAEARDLTIAEAIEDIDEKFERFVR